MSVQQLPSGRWRAQVYDPATHRNVSVSRVLGGPGTFRTKTEAKQARAAAREQLQTWGGGRVTVKAWSERWLEDPLFRETPRGTLKESSLVHRETAVKAFVADHGDLVLDQVDAELVAGYLAGGRRNWTIAALRKMFEDARSARGGRLISVNPFAGLGIGKGKGNRGKQPPLEHEFWKLVNTAWKLTPPSFAGWLQFACVTGLRPGELDALTRAAIDVDTGEIRVDRQWNQAVDKFTTPKYGRYTAALTAPAREVLERLPAGRSSFVFETVRGTHYTASARTYHWNRVRCSVGIDSSLYLCTRHYFGWYALNILGLEPAVIAIQLGHRDGGKLVEELYGHRDQQIARERIRTAFDQRAGNVTPLRRAHGDTA